MGQSTSEKVRSWCISFYGATVGWFIDTYNEYRDDALSHDVNRYSETPSGDNNVISDVGNRSSIGILLGGLLSAFTIGFKKVAGLFNFGSSDGVGDCDHQEELLVTDYDNANDNDKNDILNDEYTAAPLQQNANEKLKKGVEEKVKSLRMKTISINKEHQKNVACVQKVTTLADISYDMKKSLQATKKWINESKTLISKANELGVSVPDIAVNLLGMVEKTLCNSKEKILKLKLDQAITNLNTALSKTQDTILKNNKLKNEDNYTWYYNKPDSNFSSSIDNKPDSNIDNKPGSNIDNLIGTTNETDEQDKEEWIRYLLFSYECLERIGKQEQDEHFTNDADIVRYLFKEWCPDGHGEMLDSKFINDKMKLLENLRANHDDNKTLTAMYTELDHFDSLRHYMEHPTELIDYNNQSQVNNMISLKPLNQGVSVPIQSMRFINSKWKERLTEKVDKALQSSGNAQFYQYNGNRPMVDWSHQSPLSYQSPLSHQLPCNNGDNLKGGQDVSSQLSGQQLPAITQNTNTNTW